MENIGLIVLIGVIGLLIVLFFVFVPVGLWISSLAANVKVSIFNLVGMRLRRVVPSKIVMPLIKATKAGLSVNVNQLEAHYLAGGNIDSVVDALIAAERAGIELPFEKAAAIDLAGRNVLEAVRMSVNPKVIQCLRLPRTGSSFWSRPELRCGPTWKDWWAVPVRRRFLRESARALSPRWVLRLPTRRFWKIPTISPSWC